MNMRVAKLPPAWREAIEELWRRRLRTLLTLLGLIFGVGAIVAMQAVGEGSQREALRLVESLGLHNLIAEATPQDADALKETRARSLGLSIADAEAALAVVPGAEKFAAEKPIKTHSVFSDSGSSDAQASGVSADYFALSSLHVAQGRALDAHDEDTLAAVAVIGGQVARELFPDGKALGQPVKVNHVWLDVVGVLADRDLGKDQFEGVQLGGESNRIYVPLANSYGIPYTLADGSSTSGGSWAALDPTTGAFDWQVATPDGVSMGIGPATEANGVVYVGDSAGSGNNMFALDAATGATLWRFPASGSVWSAPAVANGVLYWGAGYSIVPPGVSGTNTFYAFSLNGR